MIFRLEYVEPLGMKAGVVVAAKPIDLRQTIRFVRNEDPTHRLPVAHPWLLVELIEDVRGRAAWNVGWNAAPNVAASIRAVIAAAIRAEEHPSSVSCLARSSNFSKESVFHLIFLF